MAGFKRQLIAHVRAPVPAKEVSCVGTDTWSWPETDAMSYLLCCR